MPSEREKRPQVVLVNRAVVVNNEGEVLLIQRAKDDAWEPTKWEFPGGKLEQGQDISHALEKEVLEETGLLSMPTARVVYVESQILTSGKYSGLPYVVIVGIANLIGGKLELSEEHDDFAWATPEQALDYELTEETRKALIALMSRLN